MTTDLAKAHAMSDEQQNGHSDTDGKELTVDPKTLKVDDELRHLVPQHKKSEVALLERSLIEEKGCREALIVWEQKEGQYTLLDGHTRRGLCIKHGFKVRIRKVALKDKEAAKAYVKKLQLGRRNTPDHAESYLRGSHYNELKQGRGGNRRSKGQPDPLKKAEGSSKGQPDPLNEDTAEKLAKEYEVSAKTIKRDGQFASLLDGVLQAAGLEASRWELLGGDVRLNRGAVKKLSLLKGRELNRQIDHLLKHGKLPRAERSNSPKPSSGNAKATATTLIRKLQKADEKLPVAVLKAMAQVLGYTLTETAKK